MAAAYYLPGAIDGSRKGTYFLNTSKPEQRHRYVAEDIAFHEAVPGHHFQLTIAMESKDLPRRAGCCTTPRAPRGGASTASAWPTRWASTATTSPGWGSSPPTRGAPAGWSSTPACTPWAGPGGRLWTGWPSTPRCRGWRLSPRSTGTSPIPVRPWPTWWAGGRSSACAQTAAAGLGGRFDLREFHDVVLRGGSLPLPALARTVERWMGPRGRLALTASEPRGRRLVPGTRASSGVRAYRRRRPTAHLDGASSRHGRARCGAATRALSGTSVTLVVHCTVLRSRERLGRAPWCEHAGRPGRDGPCATRPSLRCTRCGRRFSSRPYWADDAPLGPVLRQVRSRKAPALVRDGRHLARVYHVVCSIVHRSRTASALHPTPALPLHRAVGIGLVTLCASDRRSSRHESAHLH